MNVTINFLIWDHKGFSKVTLSFPSEYKCKYVFFNNLIHNQVFYMHSSVKMSVW